MRKHRWTIAFTFLAAMFAVAMFCGSVTANTHTQQIGAGVGINLPHVFEGEINKRGKPVGFHSRPGGKNPDAARVARIIEGPNRCGVYMAAVEIRSGDRWLSKRSTFFPDRMSRDAVIKVILEAYEKSPKAEKFRGQTKECFVVEGYYQKGRINTAWPIFVTD